MLEIRQDVCTFFACSASKNTVFQVLWSFELDIFSSEKEQKSRNTGVLRDFLMHYQREIAIQNRIIPIWRRLSTGFFLCIPKTTRVVRGSKEAIADEQTGNIRESDKNSYIEERKLAESSRG